MRTRNVVAFCVVVGNCGAGAAVAGDDSLYELQVPAKKRVTSGERNTAKNDMDWLFRNICPSIVKKKDKPETVTEAEYQELKTRLIESRHLDPEALKKLEAEDYFKKNLERAGISDTSAYLRQCTQIAEQYASGKNAGGLDLSDICVGDKYPVWSNLNLIEKYYGEWKDWKSTGKGRKPLVFRARQCLEWARYAMNLNQPQAHDDALDQMALAGTPDETSLRFLLVPSGPSKRCCTNDEFKAAFKDIDPGNKDSEFSKREKLVLEMEKDAGVEYAGVRVWYTGQKSYFKDERNKILYRLKKDAEVNGKTIKAGELLENASDKF